MTTQKETVFNAVCSIIGNDFKEGMDCGAWFKARPDEKAKLQTIVLEAFDSGTCEIKNEQANMNTYVAGMISNHLRKDVRINGGEKYTAKNPGSRAGQGDPQIKEARKLLKTLAEGSAEAAKCQAFIDAKVAAVKAEKAKASVAIDVTALPEELRGLVG